MPVESFLGDPVPASCFPALEPVVQTPAAADSTFSFVSIPEPRVFITVISGLGMLAAMQRFRRTR